MEEKMLTYEEKEALFQRYFGYFDSYVKISLANLPRKKIPYLTYGPGLDVYTNHETIFIGLDRVDVKNEDEFILYVLYFLGHEMQHVLSTPKKPWQWGLNEGLRTVCLAMSEQLEGPGMRRFQKESDYDNFIEFLKNQGLYLSLNSVKGFVHFIQNSLEDGRIERLRSKKRFAFKNQMIYCRGAEWETCPVDFKMVGAAKKEAGTRLSIKLNQVLSLSTTSLYQKDFYKYYENDVLEDEVEKLIPHIALAVGSGTCRNCMRQSIEICKLLVPEIIEACKNMTLEDLLKELMKNISKNATYDTLSTSEEEGEDGDVMPFPGAGNLPAVYASAGTGGNGDEDGDGDGSGNSQSENGQGKPQPPKSPQKEHYSPPTNSSYEGNRNEGDTCDEMVDEKTANKIANDIKKAMLEAMSKAQPEVRIIKRIVPPKKEKVIADKAAPVNDLGVKEQYSDSMMFNEEKRTYKINLAMPADLQGRASNFEREIEKLFENQKAPNVRGRRSGKVDARSIYKMAIRELDLYEKKTKDPEFDGCAYFLEDNSGSMGYGRCSKRDYCNEALAVIEGGFKKKMPLKITAFDAQGCNYVTHEVIKGFDEVQNNSCSYNFLHQGRSGCGNKDGYSIRIATKELLQRGEKAKILIILSDGTPSDYHNYKDGLADVADAVKEARKAGIYVVGIYFADNYSSSEEAETFRGMYGTNAICTSPENIEHELVRVLKEFVFN